jgi:glycerol kinase
LARATLEATAYQTEALLDAMRLDSGLDLRQLRVDGGMVANDFLMQFQADISDVTVERASVVETTALGAAYAAGLAVGYWSSMDELRCQLRVEKTFEPTMTAAERSTRLLGWRHAVAKSFD